jgi:hypothetical protein
MTNSIKKRSLGQFFTKKHFWLKEQVRKFIKDSHANIAFDPFAGNGDLLKAADSIGFNHVIGMDIDASLKWQINDGLKNIPRIENSIIITNPPYLALNSAKRKGIFQHAAQYFEACSHEDLYMLAIEKCMQHNKFGVMIVPETFVNSTFAKNRLHSVTIIEESMFCDTEIPVCVICFDDTKKSYDEIMVFKNDGYINTLGQLERMRKTPTKRIDIRFNSSKGQIALRAIDSTRMEKPIKFMPAGEIDYDVSSIKNSSRAITTIEMAVSMTAIGKIIEHSNRILCDFRAATQDVLLSPFKGNNKNGKRRRRLDYLTARAILEEAHDNVFSRQSLF